jgi:hypothetical protein
VAESLPSAHSLKYKKFSEGHGHSIPPYSEDLELALPFLKTVSTPCVLYNFSQALDTVLTTKEWISLFTLLLDETALLVSILKCL